MYHSTLGVRVIKKKNLGFVDGGAEDTLVVHAGRVRLPRWVHLVCGVGFITCA